MSSLAATYATYAAMCSVGGATYAGTYAGTCSGDYVKRVREERVAEFERRVVGVCEELDALLKDKLSVYNPPAETVFHLLPLAMAEMTSVMGDIEQTRFSFYGATYCMKLLRIKKRSTLFAAVLVETDMPKRCVRDQFQVRCDELYQIMHVKALDAKIRALPAMSDTARLLGEARDALVKGLEVTYKDENYVFALKVLANELINSYTAELVSKLGCDSGDDNAYAGKVGDVARAAHVRVDMACRAYAKQLADNVV